MGKSRIGILAYLCTRIKTHLNTPKMNKSTSTSPTFETCIKFLHDAIDAIVESVAKVISGLNFQQELDDMARYFGGFSTFRISLNATALPITAVVFCFHTAETYLYVSCGLNLNDEDHLTNIFLRYDDLNDFFDNIHSSETKDRILAILSIVLAEALKK